MRLTAAANNKLNCSPNSGTGLIAVPIYLPPGNEARQLYSLHIDVALRLGVEIARPYTCICGTMMERKATHGLDCRKTGYTHVRHLQPTCVPCKLHECHRNWSQPECVTTGSAQMELPVIPFNKSK